MPMAVSFQARPKVIDFAYDNPRTCVPVIERLLGWWSEDCWQSKWAIFGRVSSGGGALFAQSYRIQDYSRCSIFGTTTVPSGSRTTKNIWRSGPLIGSEKHTSQNGTGDVRNS